MNVYTGGGGRLLARGKIMHNADGTYFGVRRRSGARPRPPPQLCEGDGRRFIEGMLNLKKRRKEVGWGVRLPAAQVTDDLPHRK